MTVLPGTRAMVREAIARRRGMSGRRRQYPPRQETPSSGAYAKQHTKSELYADLSSDPHASPGPSRRTRRHRRAWHQQASARLPRDKSARSAQCAAASGRGVRTGSTTHSRTRQARPRTSQRGYQEVEVEAAIETLGRHTNRARILADKRELVWEPIRSMLRDGNRPQPSVYKAIVHPALAVDGSLVSWEPGQYRRPERPSRRRVRHRRGDQKVQHAHRRRTRQRSGTALPSARAHA